MYERTSDNSQNPFAAVETKKKARGIVWTAYLYEEKKGRVRDSVVLRVFPSVSGVMFFASAPVDEPRYNGNPNSEPQQNSPLLVPCCLL